MIFNHKAQQIVPRVQAAAKMYPEIADVLSDIINLIQEMSINIHDDIQSVNSTSYTSTTLPAASAEMLEKTAIVTSGSVVFYKVCVVSGSSYVWKNIKISLNGEYFLSDGANDYTKFDQTGHQSMAGDSRPWRDELTDSLSLQKSGVGVASNVTESTVEFAYNATFNSTFTSADAMYLNIQLNHDKDLTASIYPHLHWLQAKNYSPNLLLEYRWQVNGGAKTTAWTKLLCNALAFTYSSGTIHQISYASPISVPVGTTLSDIVQFRIYRDTGNASTLFSGNCPYNTGGNASVPIMAFDIHFQTNSLGSTEEYTK